MSLKAKVEAIIYAAEEPITLEQISLLLKDIVLADLASAKENAAIEQADSVADALASEATADAVAAEESALLPELAIESAEEICPEAGPLMPDVATSAPESEETQATQEPQKSAPAGLQEEALEVQEVPARGEDTTENSTRDIPELNPQSETEAEEQAVEIAAESEVSATVEAATEANPPAVEEPAPGESAVVTAPETTSRKRQPRKTEQEIAEDKTVRARIREILAELIADYASEDRGMEIRQVAGGFRMATKPEHHDVVRAFAKSLKPPIRLSLAALETLAVIAYKQPVTAPEIADIRGVESASVLGTLLDRKLITTAGRKQVIGRPMQYKTSKDFLLRFGLNDVNELPSMEEFSQLASDGTIEITPSEPKESGSLFEPEASGKAAEQDGGEQLAPETQPVVSSESTADTESGDLEINDQGSQIPESQQRDAAEAVDAPQSEAESSNVPEAEHPIGR